MKSQFHKEKETSPFNALATIGEEHTLVVPETVDGHEISSKWYAELKNEIATLFGGSRFAGQQAAGSIKKGA